MDEVWQLVVATGSLWFFSRISVRLAQGPLSIARSAGLAQRRDVMLAYVYIDVIHT